MPKILVIDSDPRIREVLNVDLKEIGYIVYLASNGNEGLEIVENFNPDIVICDLIFPDDSGLGVLGRIKEYNSFIKVILLTACSDMSKIMKAMEIGLFDYLEKPLKLDQLKLKISRALEIQHISQHLKSYINSESEEYKLENSLVGRTPVMRNIANYIEQLSMNRVSVLITGESGTGKQLIAKTIHFTGISKKHPFISVNCSALPEKLLESELFGHAKGAFPEAIREEKGKIELANEGTIFIDEISELSLQLQNKLLKVLNEREFVKVGGKHSIPMKARILVASNKNIEALVKKGRFIEDLYNRLKVFKIDLPPLRERKADIPIIVTHFLRKINNELHKNVKKVSIEVMEFLQDYDWPGNVRELENTLYLAIVLSNNDVLLKEHIHINHSYSEPINSENLMSLEEIEKRHILKILDIVNGDKNIAIKILGISKPTLYSKLKKYNLFNGNIQ